MNFDGNSQPPTISWLAAGAGKSQAKCSSSMPQVSPMTPQPPRTITLALQVARSDVTAAPSLGKSRSAWTNFKPRGCRERDADASADGVCHYGWRAGSWGKEWSMLTLSSCP